MGLLQLVLYIIVLNVIFAGFEAWRPAQPDQPKVERLRNIALTFLLLILGGLVTSLALSFLPAVATGESHSFAFSLLIVLLSVMATDFIFYWYHRAQHRFPWLWAIHELHHSDEYLNASSSYRTFWLEHTIQAILITMPVALISHLDARAVIILPWLLIGWLFFTHANLRLHLGRLTPVVTGPQLHRLHHSSLPQHQDKNFAQYFPIIDIIFGTYAPPAKHEYPPTGTSNLKTRVSVTKALFGPLH